MSRVTTQPGLLWFDDSTRSLDEKVRRAAARYTQKFGEPPTVCHCNPRDVNGVENVDGIKIVARPNVLPHHLWLGVESKILCPGA